MKRGDRLFIVCENYDFLFLLNFKKLRKSIDQMPRINLQKQVNKTLKTL